VLGALVSGLLLGQEADELLARRRRRKHRKHVGRRRRRHHRGKNDDHNDDEKPTVCYPGTHCFPGHGATNAGCDFSGSDVFRDVDAHGAILSDTNFTGADASGANFRGAVLNGACFVDATLDGAIIDNSTVLDDAIFCHTVMPDGSLNNTGCNNPTACCPTEHDPSAAGCTDNNNFCSGNQANCLGFDDCGCFTTVENDQICGNTANFLGCPVTTGCTSSDDCEDVEFCVDLPCCPEGKAVCVPLCVPPE
jgi:hypothetical protein